MTLDAFIYRSPILALLILGVLLLGSHVWNAAVILDRRRAEARNRRATAARLSAGRAFVEAYNASHAGAPITITGRPAAPLFSQPDPVPSRRELPPGFITREEALAQSAAILADRRLFRRGR